MNAQATSPELKDIMTHQYREDGREALLTARGSLERAMRELDRYLDRYEQAESTQDMINNLNWAINELASNILGNARLDMLAHAQAKLASLSK